MTDLKLPTAEKIEALVLAYLNEGVKEPEYGSVSMRNYPEYGAIDQIEDGYYILNVDCHRFVVVRKNELWWVKREPGGAFRADLLEAARLAVQQ